MYPIGRWTAGWVPAQVRGLGVAHVEARPRRAEVRSRQPEQALGRGHHLLPDLGRVPIRPGASVTAWIIDWALVE